MLNKWCLRGLATFLTAALIAGTLWGLSFRVSVKAEKGFVSIGVQNTAYAQELEVGEIVEKRTQSSKTHYLGDNKYSLDTIIGSAHYKDTFNNWREIDNAWVVAQLPWNWQMVTDGYQTYVLNNFTAGQVLKFESQGQSVAFQPMELQWTNNLNQIQSISVPQNVPVSVTNEPVELLPGMSGGMGKIRWDNAYGVDRHFEWTNTPGRLEKQLQLDTSLPVPAQYIVDGGNPALRLNFIFDPSSELDIVVNGALWDKSSKKQTVGRIEFWQEGEIVWVFNPVRYWDGSEENEGIGVTELRKSGNSLYVSALVPYAWLQTAAYPVLVDPTVELFPNNYRYFHAETWNGDKKWLLDEPDGVTPSNSSILLVDSSTGVKYPATVSTIQETGDDNDWVGPTDVGADDAVYASITHPSFDSPDTSYLLKATNLNMGVPTGATISGILVETERYYANGLVADYDVCLTKDGNARVGDDKSTGAAFPSSPGITSFGGTADLWGATWTAAEINASTFGVLYKMQATGANADGFVDFIRITVYYISCFVQGFSSEAITADNLSAGHWGFYLWGNHNGTTLVANLFVEIRKNNSNGTLLATSTNTPSLTTTEAEYYCHMDFPETAWASGDKVWVGIYVNIATPESGKYVYFYYDHTSRPSRAVDPTIDIQVGASSDDCLAYYNINTPAWVLSLTYAHQLVGYSSTSLTKMGGGMRFLALGISQAADIITANITFVCSQAFTPVIVNSRFTGEDVDDAATFSNIADYQARRGTVVGGANDDYITDEQVDWDALPAWVLDTSYSSPSLVPIIQEIVDRPGFSESSDMVIFWDDHDGRGTQGANRERRGASWDNVTYNSPTLHIEYSVAGEPDISVSPTFYSFGVVQAGSSTNTTTNYFTVTNNSSMQTDQTISVTTSTWSGGNGWNHNDSGSPGDNATAILANRGGSWGTGDVVVKNAAPNFIYENCPATTNYDFGLGLWTPLTYYDGYEKTITVRISAVSG